MLLKGQQVDVRDARGILVQEGDTIIAGFSHGSSAEVRYGRLLRYLEFPQNYRTNCYVEVEWLFSTWNTYKPKTSRLSVTTLSNVHPNRRDGEYWVSHSFTKAALELG